MAPIEPGDDRHSDQDDQEPVGSDQSVHGSTLPLDDNTLWYLKHEDFWCVHTALAEYRLSVKSAPIDLQKRVIARTKRLQARLREVH
jgi:hypothetical protein